VCAALGWEVLSSPPGAAYTHTTGSDYATKHQQRT
jgi:hypothetical protein